MNSEARLHLFEAQIQAIEATKPDSGKDKRGLAVIKSLAHLLAVGGIVFLIVFAKASGREGKRDL